MARRFGASIDLLTFSLLNAMLHPVSSDPSGLTSGDKGRVWFNTTSNKLMVWNGTTAIDLLARANHTGTQTASTISDLATVVQAYRLDQFAAPNTDLSIASHKLTNVTDPASAQDAATKNYVDTLLAGLASGQVLKGAVKVATTTNINLSAPGATLDGISMSTNDIFLATGQTTASANGPYVYNGSATPATRATNWDTSAEAVLGSYWIVEQGTNADTFGLLTNDSAITLGTTALTFVFRGAAGASYSAGNGLQLGGTVFSILLDAASGLSVSGSGLKVDGTVVARKAGGAVPATTSGIFTVSGSAVTINHGLGNTAPQVVVTVGGTPASGYTTLTPVETDWVVVDSNNVTITFPAAPAAGNWVVTVIG
jgi:hypothetical protein